MYTIKYNTVDEVRVSSNGNLVTMDGSLVARKGEVFPKLYNTFTEAQEAHEKQMEACEHKFIPLSHEERGCSKCGAVELVVDM